MYSLGGREVSKGGGAGGARCEGMDGGKGEVGRKGPRHRGCCQKVVRAQVRMGDKDFCSASSELPNTK